MRVDDGVIQRYLEAYRGPVMDNTWQGNYRRVESDLLVGRGRTQGRAGCRAMGGRAAWCRIR